MSTRSESDLHRRALDVFDVASEYPAAEQQTWLTRAHPDDPALRAAVSRLLGAARRSAMMPTEVPDAAPLSDDQRIPDRIGPYRPVALLGEGGMGRVYRAERADGHFEQTVAIKVVATSLFAGTAAAQFLVERQILAKLRHPNIAQLFDGGVTQAGQPYLVMELIDGEPITVNADARNLDGKSRLLHFMAVCDAVQYAHQQLVVHADIKPGNVMVDARGTAKLVDFGIGALIGDRTHTDEVRVTAQTPAWASPQLVAGERPTPPDDVFALGLLLRALVPDGRSNADIDAVADRAAASDPADRYPSADALAADVARYLDGRPVVARGADRLHAYRLFWRRNRLAIVATAAAASALLVALAVTATLYVRAEAARHQTLQRFEEVRALSRFMLNDVTDSLEQFPGTSRLRRSLAVRGRDYLERLSKIPGASSDVRLETAEGYEKVGTILARSNGANLGDPLTGRAALIRADTELTGLLAASPQRDDIRVFLAHTLVVEATVAGTAFNDNKAAFRSLDRADRLLAAIRPNSAIVNEAGWVRWDARNARANILNDDGRFAEMLPLLTTALSDGLALGVPHRHLIDRPLYAAATLRLIGDAQYYLDHREQALATYKRAVGIVERARASFANARLFDRSAYYHYEVASTLSTLGRSREALTWIDKASSIIATLETFDDSPRTLHIANIVTLQRAEVLGELRRYPEAIAEMQANIAARRRLARAHPQNYDEQRAIPVSLRPMVGLYFAAGQMEAGCRTLNEAHRLWSDLAAHGNLGGYDRTQEMQDLAELQKRCP